MLGRPEGIKHATLFQDKQGTGGPLCHDPFSLLTFDIVIRKPAIRFETFDLFWASPPPILAELFTQISPSMPASDFPTFPHIFACGSACISGEANCRFTDVREAWPISTPSPSAWPMSTTVIPGDKLRLCSYEFSPSSSALANTGPPSLRDVATLI